jgi:glycosyltransferase involved in cell wall biosynthesis
MRPLGDHIPAKKVRFLTNIPTPYRNYQFNQIALAAKTRATIDFEVWFTGEAEPPRVLQMPGEGTWYRYQFLQPPSRWSWPLRGLATISRLVTLLNGDRPDIVIVGGYFNVTLQVACLLTRVPVPFRAVLYCENHRPFRGSPVLKVARRFLTAGFRTFIVPGSLQENYVRQLVGGKAPLKFHRMPNVVAEDVFRKAVEVAKAARSRIRQELSLPESCRVFLSVMRLEPVKGCDLLVEAAEGLPDHCRVLIAGDGSLRPALERHHCVLSGKVRLLGHLPQERIVPVLAASDAFVLPSRNDAYPLAVIEALCAGLPLIISDAVGCHREALEADLNGYLFEAGSAASLTAALRRVAALDEGSLRRMGEASAALARQRFSAQKIAEEFVEFLEIL